VEEALCPPEVVVVVVVVVVEGLQVALIYPPLSLALLS